MSKRIVRGHYKIRQLDGGWRTGPLLAGTRIETGEGDCLEMIECIKPLALMRGNMLLYLVPNVPCWITFGPWELCGPIDVRRLGRG